MKILISAMLLVLLASGPALASGGDQNQGTTGSGTTSMGSTSQGTGSQSRAGR